MTLLLTLVILTLDIIYYIIEATPIILSFFLLIIKLIIVTKLNDFLTVLFEEIS